MRQHEASFANFICRFGGHKVLLDYAQEIVLPAFTDDSLVRSYGDTSYFFHSVEVEVKKDGRAEPLVLLSGHFIKNTKLTREQIFEQDKGIIHDEATLSSAPSAFFVLILNNHRLIYYPSTSHAPSMSNFKSTVMRFLKLKHDRFINGLYEELEQEGQKQTKKKLRETHPAPTLEVIPISGDEQIDAFVRRYELLQKIEFKIVRPNDEIDGGELFDEIREFLDPVEPTDTKLIARRSGGFDIEKAIPRIKHATDTDNQEVKLTGKDGDGNKLRGDNHEFKISAPVEPVPPTRKGLVKRLLEVFEGLMSDGAIKTGARDPSVKEKILALVRAL